MASIATMIGLLMAVPARGEDPKMLKGIEYHHAGVVLAVPDGAVYEQTHSPFDVMQARIVEKVEQENRVVTIRLAAHPVDQKVSAQSFSDDLNAELGKIRGILDFKPVKRTQMNVAGITGTAEMLRFRIRQEEKVSTRLVFIREVEDSGLRICYVLTAEAPLKHKDRMLGVFGAVVNSVLLVPLRHPCAVVVNELARPVRLPDRRFEVRPPRSWHVVITRSGVEMGQMDYLLGEIAARVRVTVMDLHSETNAKECAENEIARAKKDDKTNNTGTEVVWQGPADLGGRAGYSFILRRTARGKNSATAAPEILARRIVCIPAEADRPHREYTLSMNGRSEDLKKVEGIFEKIASGFRFIEPTTAPTTAPATATAPASAPTTVPASAAAPKGKPNSERHGLPFGAVALTGRQRPPQPGMQR